MELRRMDETGGFVQYDGDEPVANKDFNPGREINSNQKHQEHVDTLRGVYRTENTEKLVAAIDKYMKKAHKKEWEEREKRLGEVTAAAQITPDKIKEIIELLKDRERGEYILYDTDGNPQSRVIDWLSTTRRHKR